MFDSLAAAIAAAGGDGFVIGGGATYEAAMPLLDRIYATEVEAAPVGDAHFPELGRSGGSCGGAPARRGGERRCVHDPGVRPS